MKGTAYLLQATLISLWWIGLLMDENFYAAFQFPNINATAFNSFLLPDLIIIAILSTFRAYSDKKELGYIILGGFAFATLYCINATLLTKGGYLSTTVMFIGLCYNLFLVFEKQLFRISNTKNVFTNGIKTIVQVICIWTITLFVFPRLIMESFGEIPTPIIENKQIGSILFLLFSCLGIYSGFTMVKNGEGTPLPIDQTQKLVTTGPYKYVRNPMAVAGIGQAISISIIFSSIPVLIYAIIGAIFWHFVVRPIEEKDMEKRFGKGYLEYREKIRCWIPRIK